MIVIIRQLVSPAEAAEILRLLNDADWADGRGTAGYLGARVKNNAQLPELHPLALQLGNKILEALSRNAQFRSAALPLKVVPPLFNRYAGGQSYGSHIDGGIRPVAGSTQSVRTDLVRHLVPQRSRRL